MGVLDGSVGGGDTEGDGVVRRVGLGWVLVMVVVSGTTMVLGTALS